MDRKTYCDTVRAQLRSLTKEERAQACAELDAHMEDHICSLLELGYDAALAEERTLALMGDPAEVGRELNRQYPLGWLAVGYVARALTLVLLLCMLSPLWNLGGQVKDHLAARFWPLREWDMAYIRMGDTDLPVAEELTEIDLRRTVDGVTMRLYQVGLEDPEAAETTAWVAVTWYSENPLRKTPQLRGAFSAPDGREVTGRVFSGQQQWLIYVPVKWGEVLEFTYDQNGHRYDFTVELPWKEAAV
ncbi:MAG: hypothetical protein E7429_05330 [Ruminococcaceae bacterium]|nr:hypothetical protein [Oscillospiraceae bacterium]